MAEIKRVLIVEDDPDIQQSHMYFLKNKNLEFDTAESLNESLEKIYRKTYHLALIDIMLKDDSRDRGGIEVIKQIGNYNEGTKIIVISSTNDVHVPIEVFRCGIVDFLHKSTIKRDILIDKVNQALDMVDLTKKSFGNFESLHAYLAAPDTVPIWEDKMYSSIGTTYGFFIKSTWALFNPILPVLRPKENLESLLADSTKKSISGIFWSKSIGSAVWVYLSGNNEILDKSPVGECDTELISQSFKDKNLRGGVWTLTGVPRDFFKVTVWE